jgi:hypothetical protein
MNSKFHLKSNQTTLAIAGLLLCAPLIAPATVLFSDNFNIDNSPSWTKNVAPAANAAQQDAVWAFDYSAFGIPPAPGSTDTLGLRVRSNIPGSAAAPVTTRPNQAISGISVSPTGQNFGTNYHVSFYAWANFNGSPSTNALGLADNANSEGGTHNILFAVGTSGTLPLVVGNTGLASGASMDGIGFATTGDGGITLDYRVYPKSGTISVSNSGVYAAGIGNDIANVPPTGNVNVYYEAIPSLQPHSAPAIQQSLSTAEYGLDALNTQAGQTQNGAFGFAWHRVDLLKVGNFVKWTIDNTAIATIDTTALGALGGNNIALGDSDVNSTTTRHPSLLFSLFDNLLVTDITSPTIQAATTNGTLTLTWPLATGGGFTLQSATNLTPPVVWTKVTNLTTINATNASLSMPATNAPSFFRLALP